MEVGRYSHPLPVPGLGVLGLSFIASLKCLIKLFPLHPTSQCPLVKHHCRDVVTPESALRMLPLSLALTPRLTLLPYVSLLLISLILKLLLLCTQ